MTWIFVAVAGFGLAMIASRWAVQQAAMLAYGTTIPPFLIGITFFAIGTDVPEIANSVVASMVGHGDLNVGDSVGSVMTQITLVLGLLPFFGGSFVVGRYRASTVSLLTIAALILGIFLVKDGYLSQWDAVAFLLIGIGATAIAWHYSPPESEPVMIAPKHRRVYHALMVMLCLLLVAAGAGAAVKGITELSMQMGVPEYLISFFGSSIGTSLPELVVDITALRRGQRDIAFGDVTGSCLVDATFSIAAGPLFFPTAVTARLAVVGAIVAIGAVFLASFVIWLRRKHDRWSGAFLLVLYGIIYAVMLAAR